jgi:hypothetical protein
MERHLVFNDDEEENLLGGEAAEFEGAEGLSPPKSSQITGLTPQNTPKRKPLVETPSRKVGLPVSSLVVDAFFAGRGLAKLYPWPCSVCI